MKKLSIILVVLLMSAFFIEVPNMAYNGFRFLTKKGEGYLLEDLKTMHQLDIDPELITSHVESKSPMKIDYISNSKQTPLVKYKIRCNNYSYSVLVWRFSSIADSIDKVFEDKKIIPVY